MGRGVNIDTHSTDWLLHLQGGLWITVQVKIRQQQTVHTSSHNNQYIFMPILYIQDLTQLDGFNNMDKSHLEDTAVRVERQHVSVAILSCQTHGV